MSTIQDPAPARGVAASSAVNRGHAKQLFALSAGHALEWYDWAMFGLLSVYIGQAFFPGGDPITSTLNSLAVFAVGFIVRPIGGFV